ARRAARARGGRRPGLRLSSVVDLPPRRPAAGRRDALALPLGEALQGGARALLRPAGTRGGRLLRRLRVRCAVLRRRARGLPRHAPSRADGFRGPRAGLPPGDRDPGRARLADPRPPGPRRVAGALRAGRRRLRPRDGALGGCVRAFPPDRADRDREPLARGLPRRAAGGTDHAPLLRCRARWLRHTSFSVVADAHVQLRTLRSAPPSGLVWLAI